jgi:hypothetical protein
MNLTKDAVKKKIFLNSVEELLSKLCDLNRLYLQIAQQESDALVAVSAEAIAEIFQKRSSVLAKISNTNLSLIAVLEKFVQDESESDHADNKTLNKKSNELKVEQVTIPSSVISKRENHQKSLKISTVLKNSFDTSESLKAFKLIEELKKLIENVEIKNRELNQMNDFSLRLVNGSLSILWSATQNINRVYSKDGNINEKAQVMRAHGTLKSA